MYDGTESAQLYRGWIVGEYILLLFLLHEYDTFYALYCISFRPIISFMSNLAGYKGKKRVAFEGVQTFGAITIEMEDYKMKATCAGGDVVVKYDGVAGTLNF